MTPKLRATLRNIDKRFDAVRAMPPPIAEGERHRRSIEEVGRNGYLGLAGSTWRVEDVSHYQEKKNRWYELELIGIESGETRFLEWERDDGLEVSFNAPRFSLRNLGLTSDEIEAMSEADEGTISHAGRRYEYDDDYGATFHRGGAGEGEKVYFYDFETADERYGLAVEEWGDAEDGYSYEVYLSEYLDPDAIEVLVVGEKVEH
jgi:hypothetical protein